MRTRLGSVVFSGLMAVVACKDAGPMRPAAEGPGLTQIRSFFTIGQALLPQLYGEAPYFLATFQRGELVNDFVRREGKPNTVPGYYYRVVLREGYGGNTFEGPEGTHWAVGEEVWVASGELQPPCGKDPPREGQRLLLRPRRDFLATAPDGQSPALEGDFVFRPLCVDDNNMVRFQEVEGDPTTPTGRNTMSDIAVVPLDAVVESLSRFRQQTIGLESDIARQCESLGCGEGTRCYFGITCVKAINLAVETDLRWTMDGTKRATRQPLSEANEF